MTSQLDAVRSRPTQRRGDVAPVRGTSPDDQSINQHRYALVIARDDMKVRRRMVAKVHFNARATKAFDDGHCYVSAYCALVQQTPRRDSAAIGRTPVTIAA